MFFLNLRKSSLIVSIAAAVLLLGIAFALGMKFGITVGILCGVGVFVALIAVLLILNKTGQK